MHLRTLVTRLVVGSAVVALLGITLGGGAPSGSPYLSALASLGGSPALAAPACGYKGCSKEPGRKSPTCIKSLNPNNCSASQNVCVLTAC